MKDTAPPGTAAEGGWADTGHGTIDWPSLVPFFAGTAADHIVAGHDNPSDWQRFARRSGRGNARPRPGGTPLMASSLEIYDLGRGEARQVLATDRLIEAPNWSRDGRFLWSTAAGGSIG